MNSFELLAALWRLSGRQKLAIGVTLVVVGSVLWFSVGRPLHEHNTQVLQVMREQLALLPPPADATITRTVERGAYIGSPTLLFDYAFSGTCDDTQAHYAHAAPQAGWSVTKPVYLARSVDPENDNLTSNYQKVVEGYKLALEIDCRANAPAGDGYSAGVDQV